MLKAVIRDSFIYGLASILSRGLAVLLLPIYTRVLSPTDYGVYDLLVTLVALANLVVALEVSQGLARYWLDTDHIDGRVRFASTALLFSVVMYLFVCGLALIFAESLSRLLLNDIAYISAFRLGVVFIAFNGLYYLVLNQFRWELRSSEYSAISLAYAVLTLIGVLLFCLFLEMGLRGVLLAQIVATLVCLVVSLWRLKGSFRLDFDIGCLRTMLVFSFPLVPSGIAVFVSLYINRFALLHYTGMEEVGIYGLAARIGGLVTLLILGVQAALTPLVYQHAGQPETPRQIALLFRLFVAVALLGCLGLGLFASELVVMFATQVYDGAAPLVAILAPAMILSQMYVFAPGIGIRKKTVYQLVVTFCTAAVSVLANWILVPAFGMFGAAWATLFSSALFLVGWFWLSQQLYPIPYAWKSLFVCLLAYAACSTLGMLIDLSGQFFLVLSIKAVILIAMAMALIVFRLVSLVELQAGYSWLRGRVLRK